MAERRPRVVITDVDFPSTEIERRELAAVDAEVIVGQCATEDDVVELCADADGIILQYAPITRRVIAHLDRCRVLSRYGIGVDTIDVQAATERGIWVCNAGDYCRAEVAEHAMALLLALGRRLFALDRSVHAGIWNTVGAMGPAPRLQGQTLGLIGFGTIGREVAARARAFGLRLLTYDPVVTPELAAEHGAELVTLDDLLARSDFVSLHCPLIRQTHHLIDATTLRQMKPTAFLVNTSRGGLVDQPALAEALRAGMIAGAAVDVLEKEPIDRDDPLLDLPNAIITPHAAFYSADSLEELQKRTALNVVAALRGERPPWALNKLGGA